MGSPSRGRRVELLPEAEPVLPVELQPPVAAALGEPVFDIARLQERLLAVSRGIPGPAENFWQEEFSGSQMPAIDHFWRFYGENAVAEREALRQAVLQYIQNPRNQVEQTHLTAINVLWYAPFEKGEDRSLLWPILVNLAQNPGYPCQWSILSQLWIDGQLGREEKCTTLHPIFLQIARTPHHPHQWDAIRKLCDTWYVWREQGRSDLWGTLLELAQDPAFPQRWLACYELWDFGGQRGREEGIVVRLLEEAAHNFDDTPWQWQAITRLWHSGRGRQIQSRERMRPLISRISWENGHPYQRSAIHLLITSQDPQDQVLGESLQYQLFEELPAPPEPHEDGGGA